MTAAWIILAFVVWIVYEVVVIRYLPGGKSISPSPEVVSQLELLQAKLDGALSANQKLRALLQEYMISLDNVIRDRNTLAMKIAANDAKKLFYMGGPSKKIH